MTSVNEQDPHQLFEQRRSQAEADYQQARFAHMADFYAANPELAIIRDDALENMADLEEFPVHESEAVYEEPHYRWAEANYAWVTAQEQRAFLVSQRSTIAERSEQSLIDIDVMLADMEDEIALREYMKNLYDARESAARVTEQTKLYDFPTTEGMGSDWVGMGHKIVEARLQELIFDTRYVASGYQDYGYAPDDGPSKLRELMDMRDARELRVPTERRLFFYQPFTRDPRDMIRELAAKKEALGDNVGRFFDMRTAQMVANDAKSTPESAEEAKEILAKELAWWEDISVEEQAETIRQAEAYFFSTQHTYQRLISGFAPVVNLAIDKVKSVYPHAHDQGNFKKLQEDAILSAAFYFNRVERILDTAGKDQDDLDAIMGYLYAQIVLGFDNVVLDSDRRVSSKRLAKVFEGTGGLPQVIFEEGYFDNEAFVPDRIRPYTMRELTGYAPQKGRKRQLGGIASGATIVLHGSRTLEKPTSTLPGYDPLLGFDDKIAAAAKAKKAGGLALPGLNNE